MTSQKKYPIPSSAQEDLEEALGIIFHCYEEGIREKKAILAMIADTVNSEIYPTLLQRGLVFEEDGKVKLNPEGQKLAAGITRRHRLAERLLSDVLALPSHFIDPNACQLEHIISEEVSESICTLLGHPSQCPHGTPIPKGPCCDRAEKSVESIITSLDKLKAGAKAKVAYISLQNHPDLHKLLALGLIPGTLFSLHQTYPTFVLEIGETTLALEKEIAEKILVRKIEHQERY